MLFRSRDGMEGNEEDEKDFHPCLYLHSGDTTVQTVVFLRKNSFFL